jgi:dTDP-glucose pyrophosphorylase
VKIYKSEVFYVVEPSLDGLAQAFILGAEFIGNNDVCLVLGDDIFYALGLLNIKVPKNKSYKDLIAFV